MAKEVESTLRLEFEQWLAKEKEILTAKYETEVDELRTSKDAEIEKCDTEIQELAILRKSDCDGYAAELGFGVCGIGSSTSVSKGWSMLFMVHFLFRFSTFAPSRRFPSYSSLLQMPSPTLPRMRQPRWRSVEQSTISSAMRTPWQNSLRRS
jgi:hypothetical protein